MTWIDVAEFALLKERETRVRWEDVACRVRLCQEPSGDLRGELEEAEKIMREWEGVASMWRKTLAKAYGPGSDPWPSDWSSCASQ
jgi:hypothetical protein